MSDSLEQDAPWLLWMLCSSCYAVYLACGIASVVLVGSLGGDGLDVFELAIGAMSLFGLGVEALAFSGSSLLFPVLGFCVLLYMLFNLFLILAMSLQAGGVADDRILAITAVPLVCMFALILTQWPLLVDIMVLCAQLMTSMAVYVPFLGFLGDSGTLVGFLGEEGSDKRRYFCTLVMLSLVAIMFARRGLFLNMLALIDLKRLCAGPAKWLVFRLGGGGPNVDLYGSVTTAVMMGLFLVGLAFATSVTVKVHPFVSEPPYLRSSKPRPKTGF